MVPIPLPPKKRGDDRSDVSIGAVMVWTTPFVFFVPLMVIAGLGRVLRPKMKDDIDRYLRRLAALLEKAMESAVAYRQAGEKAERPSLPPDRSARGCSRPGGVTRPGGKPGASRSSGRSRTRR